MLDLVRPVLRVEQVDGAIQQAHEPEAGQLEFQFLRTRGRQVTAGDIQLSELATLLGGELKRGLLPQRGEELFKASKVSSALAMRQLRRK